jgi:SAM-dependent methyltransferase
MSTNDQAMRETWETSFKEQVARGAYNTAPVEALVRTVSYYLRDRVEADAIADLHFAELGCGAGPNLVWLAEKGMRVSGVDIAPTALDLARGNLERHGFTDQVGELVEGSVADVPWADGSMDGLLESCVFQHLPREDRERAFAEVRRLLRPGGVFVGHMLEQGHTIFAKHERDQLAGDPGTVQLEEGGSNIYLSNIGLSHFFTKDEIHRLFDGFTLVEPCLAQYEIPASEARKRGYDAYLQSMLIVYAVK